MFSFSAMDSFVKVAQHLNTHVSPYCLSATLVFAAELNGVTAYLFTASFLVWVSMVAMYATAMVYKYGLIEFFTRRVRDCVHRIVTQLKQLQHFYIVKASVGVLLAYFVGSCLLCLRHVDVVEAIRATLGFIVRIPALLFDTDGLIQMIQQWLHRVFLSHIVHAIGTLWQWQKSVIEASLLWGTLSVCGTFVIITVILECAVWIHRHAYGSQLVGYVAAAWRFAQSEKTREEQANFNMIVVSLGIMLSIIPLSYVLLLMNRLNNPQN